MEKFTLQDNTADAYIPITPTKPQIGYIHKEESQQFNTREYDYDGINNVDNTISANTFSELVTRQALPSDVRDIPVVTANAATDYVGAVHYEVPYVINPDFADFLLLDVQANPFSSLGPTTIETATTELYDVGDTSAKVVSMFNGMQGLRIPADKFNSTVSGTLVKNFGKYYIKVSPKFIDAPVLDFIRRKQVPWQSVNGLDAEGRRQITHVDNNNFKNTVWLFEDALLQRGRLHGSVVEVWDAGLTTKKQVKVLVEDALDLSGGVASLVITPDTMGYDSPNEVVSAGDILRVYPRETYFNPIFIEVSYDNKDNDLLALIRFMKNDAVRDLTSNVIEVYDDSGVGTDPNGNLTGVVVQAYQISKEGTREVRRKLNLD